jgi:deoxyribonuclease-4
MTLRVRHILDNTDKRTLYKYIPKYVLPENKKGIFPSSIGSCLPTDEKCSIIGLLTEFLVLYENKIELHKNDSHENNSHKINNDRIFEGLERLDIFLSDIQKDKIIKSKTTINYLEKINNTRKKLFEFIKKDNNPILKEQELRYKSIQGHPDGIYNQFAIEIKTTSKLEKDIKYYMLQLLSYLALDLSRFEQAILVLPLQESIITFDKKDCRDIKKYLELLNEKAEAIPKPNLENIINIQLLIQSYNIGYHMKKSKTFLQTVVNMNSNIPYQIFMGGAQTSKININEEDIKNSSLYIQKNNIKLYVHSPYIINLCSKTEDDWQLLNLAKLLKYGFFLGAKGIVVHTGKHTRDAYEVGIKRMRKSLKILLEFSNEKCPILLETPAGQGTETLCDMNEFLDSVDSFKSNKIGVCVDTCHVFANGHNPYEYLESAYSRGNLRLVHFNDSREECGSCKDRHAGIGLGKIGIEKMLNIAEFCKNRNIDMLIE